MRYPRLMMAALAAALLATTGCGRVTPTASIGPAIDAKGAVGKKLTGSATAKVTGGGLMAAGVGTVSGRVIDAASNRGVAGATVVLDPSGIRLTTDANGVFQAKGVASGTYTFQAMITGMQQISTNGVVVEANQTATVPDISMVPGNGPSGITSITYVQAAEMGRVGEAPATLVAPIGVAARGSDVLVLDVNGSAGVKTGIIRQYDASNGKFGGKYGDYTKWLGRNMMRNTVSAIALDPQGNSVVVTKDSHLWSFSASGDKKFDKEIAAENATDVAVNVTDGAIYVANGGLTKFSAAGEGGQAVGELSDVRAVAANKTDLWVVSGNQVQKLMADGTMVLSFGAAGSDDKAGAFSEATDIAVDPRNGNVVVVDKGTKNVYVFDSVGTLIGKVGQGVFDTPVSATIDDAGTVYVVDAAKKKVYKFTSAGTR